MKSRCYNPNSSEYENYGGRGIRICDEWRNDFKPFYIWAVSNGYTDELTIERVNVNGNYEPENCKWASVSEQANNKRNTIKIMYKGRAVSLRRVCSILGLNYKTEHTYYSRHGYEAEIKRLNKYVELEEQGNEKQSSE